MARTTTPSISRAIAALGRLQIRTEPDPGNNCYEGPGPIAAVPVRENLHAREAHPVENSTQAPPAPVIRTDEDREAVALALYARALREWAAAPTTPKPTPPTPPTPLSLEAHGEAWAWFWTAVECRRQRRSFPWAEAPAVSAILASLGPESLALQNERYDNQGD